MSDDILKETIDGVVGNVAREIRNDQLKTMIKTYLDLVEEIIPQLEYEERNIGVLLGVSSQTMGMVHGIAVDMAEALNEIKKLNVQVKLLRKKLEDKEE